MRSCVKLAVERCMLERLPAAGEGLTATRLSFN